jgi:hypothetical protein
MKIHAEPSPIINRRRPTDRFFPPDGFREREKALGHTGQGVVTACIAAATPSRTDHDQTLG